MSSRLSRKRRSRAISARAMGSAPHRDFRRERLDRAATEVSGVRRSWPIDDSSAARSRSRSFSTGDFADLVFELEPFMRQCRLAEQRREQHRASAPTGSRPSSAQGRSLRARRARSSSGWNCQSAAISVAVPRRPARRAPGPFRGRAIDRAERGGFGAGGDHAQLAVALVEQDALTSRSVRFPRRGRGWSLAQSDRGRAPGRTRQSRHSPARCGRRGRAALEASGEVRSEDRDADQHEQRQQALRIGDGEGIERGQEEEIIGERREDAGERCRGGNRSGRRRRSPAGDRSDRCRRARSAARPACRAASRR